MPAGSETGPLTLWTHGYISHSTLFRSGSKCFHGENKKISAIVHIYFLSNSFGWKHARSLLGLKRRNQLLKYENISSMEMKQRSHDAIMHWLQACDLKNGILLMKGFWPYWEWPPWALTSATCGWQKGKWSSATALFAVTAWHMTVSVHWIYNAKFQLCREHLPSHLKINSHEFLINNKRPCHQHSEPQPGLSWLRGQKSA